MGDNNSKKDTLVPLRSDSIEKVGNSIRITNKIIFAGIEYIFNEALYLLNSKHLQRNSENFCFLLEYTPDYLKKAGLKYIANTKDDYVRAIELFNQVILKQPHNKYAYHFHAIANIQLHNYQSAIDDYTEIIKIYPDNANAYARRGDLFQKIDKYTLAVVDYTEAIRLNPLNSEYYHERANAIFRIDEKGSLADFDKAIELDPNNIRVYNNRGRTLNSLGETELAKADFVTAVNLAGIQLISDETNGKLYHYRGWAKIKLELYNEAIEDYSKVIELDPYYTIAYYYRAKANRSIGKIQEALTDEKTYENLTKSYADRSSI